MAQLTSYFALRVRPGVEARAWWSAALAQHAPPPAIRDVLAGRTRVELSLEDARDAYSWAERIEGWPREGLTPLEVHPELPAV